MQGKAAVSKDDNALAAVLGLVRDGQKPVIEFVGGIEEQETGFDVGMRARVVGLADIGDGVTELLCDFSEFEEFNKQFGKPDYYDENGVARLHFWETRYYPKDRREKVYASAEVVPFAVVTEGSRSEAYEDFRREGEGKKYIDWLEEKYAEMKNALSSAKTKKA